MEDRPILLVVPPFRSTTSPALGVSLLKAGLAREGIPSRIFYLNVAFARQIGSPLYDGIAQLMGGWRDNLGEFVFSGVLWGVEPSEISRYLESCCRGGILGRWYGSALGRESWSRALPVAEKLVATLIRQAIDFTARAAAELAARSPWIVGVSTCAQENLASLALLARLKSLSPRTITVLGGSNCVGVPGQALFRQFPFVDYLVSGEGEEAFPSLVGELKAHGRLGRPITGVLSRERPGDASAPARIPGPSLDRIPMPEYDDYFAVADRRERRRTVLPLETTRGCARAVTNPCRFCGLHPGGREPRSKSAARVLAEIGRVANAPIRVLDCDWNRQAWRALLPRLSRRHDLSFWFEVPPHLTPEDIAAMRGGRVAVVYAGLESLLDSSLRSMHKGTSRLQNLRTLRTCCEEGLRVHWLHLWGFPGEDETGLRESIRSAWRLHHLPPPSAAAMMQLQRHSPFFEHDIAPEYRQRVPRAVYGHIYRRLPPREQEALAWFFDTPFLRARSRGAGFHSLQRMVRRWQRRFPRSHLVSIERWRSLLVIDTRRPAVRIIRLRSTEALLLERCRRPRSGDSLEQELRGTDDGVRLSAALLRLRNLDLLEESGEGFLSLPCRLLPTYRRFAPEPAEDRQTARERFTLFRSLHLGAWDSARATLRALGRSSGAFLPQALGRLSLIVLVATAAVMRRRGTA
jgi:magnesium-protoporphyrin IX monomethyl ester (oxidative) cyclase